MKIESVQDLIDAENIGFTLMHVFSTINSTQLNVTYSDWIKNY